MRSLSYSWKMFNPIPKRLQFGARGAQLNITESNSKRFLILTTRNKCGFRFQLVAYPG
jgi:hypothetical protein